jgi:hypothetical protein
LAEEAKKLAELLNQDVVGFTGTYNIWPYGKKKVAHPDQTIEIRKDNDE